MGSVVKEGRGGQGVGGGKRWVGGWRREEVGKMAEEERGGHEGGVRKR